MDIAKYLTLDADLEIQISRLYKKIAAFTGDISIFGKLIEISYEELNYATSLNMSRNYLEEAPDAFLGVKMNEEDLYLGLLECRELNDRLQQTPVLLYGLKWLLSLEKRFEQIHIRASIVVSDAHLKQLFQALAGGDQNHSKTLQEIIAVLEAH